MPEQLLSTSSHNTLNSLSQLNSVNALSQLKATTQSNITGTGEELLVVNQDGSNNNKKRSYQCNFCLKK